MDTGVLNVTKIIAGVDEVGVGPLAGPVVAAAVILDPDYKIYKLRDSKILTANQREILFEKIQKKALSISLGMASVEEVDELNIFHATMLAMERAIKGLTLVPELIMIDGRSSPKISLPVQTIVGGDKTVKSISAASIIAKVTRDRLMNEYHHQFPDYRFDKHKGYSTKEHQALLKQFGACPLHRRSFQRVKNVITA